MFANEPQKSKLKSANLAISWVKMISFRNYEFNWYLNKPTGNQIKVGAYRKAIFLIIPQAFLNVSLRLFAYQNNRYIV